MSLINDALKKAQKRHASGAAPLPPPVPGGAPADRPAARRSPLPSQLVILCALGAAVLIALSVLATVYLLRRPSAPGPVAAQPAAIPVPVEKPATPVLVQTTAPGGSPQAPASPVVAAAPLPPPVKPAPAPAPPVVAVASVAAPAIQPAVSVAPPLDPTKPDPKILAYVDALQVAGVRITSAGGKVLMNDRVYRQNDVVDRLLGLRLKKIGDDTLIFIDERGVTYTKNF